MKKSLFEFMKEVRKRLNKNQAKMDYEGELENEFQNLLYQIDHEKYVEGKRRSEMEYGFVINYVHIRLKQKKNSTKEKCYQELAKILKRTSGAIRSIYHEGLKKSEQKPKIKTKELVNKMGLTESTLRKYRLMLEVAGYRFEKEKNQRVFQEEDMEAMLAMKESEDKSKTAAHYAKIQAEKEVAATVEETDIIYDFFQTGDPECIEFVKQMILLLKKTEEKNKKIELLEKEMKENKNQLIGYFQKLNEKDRKIEWLEQALKDEKTKNETN